MPDTKFENLKKVLSENVDLTWLIDQARSAGSGSKETHPLVYVLSFDGDPTAAGVELLAKEVTAVLESTDPVKEAHRRFTAMRREEGERERTIFQSAGGAEAEVAWRPALRKPQLSALATAPYTVPYTVL